jgi:putative ABC transport system substrate-binding protein
MATDPATSVRIHSRVEKVLLTVSVLVASALLAYGSSKILLWMFSRQTTVGPQQSYHIGILQRTTVFDETVRSFRARLSELGYGGIVGYTAHKSFGDDALMRFQAEQLVERKSDLILGLGSGAAVAVRAATEQSAIPGLFFTTPDPVALGLIQGYSQSGTTMVGVGGSNTIARQLEILKQLKSDASTLGVIGIQGDISSESFLSEIARLAPTYGLAIVEVTVDTKDDVHSAIAALADQGVRIGYLTPSGTADVIAADVAAAAIERGILLTGTASKYVEYGVLFSYFVDIGEVGEQLADLAHRILQGEKPASMVPRGPVVCGRRLLRLMLVRYRVESVPDIEKSLSREFLAACAEEQEIRCLEKHDGEKEALQKQRPS